MLKARQLLGKYRITGRLGEGGFATVYRAHDTIEGIPVALKIPHPRLVTKDVLESFRKEVRLTANLDHPNILPIKNAAFVGRQFVIAYPLGEGTLDERLKRRLATRTALHYAEQMLEALAFAHRHRIIHCDIKPDNFILFPGGRVRLADFGIAKVAQSTALLQAKGTGTIGYVAPEQAMGKPSLRSDVFALGLVFYRLFSGRLPEWPYDWPPPGFDRLRERLHPDFIAIIEKALQVDERARHRDGAQMLAAFRRVRHRALLHAARRRRHARRPQRPDWDTMRQRDFQRRHGAALGINSTCGKCDGPVAESMWHCPWCGTHLRNYRGPTKAPRRCRRCSRGVKSDWRFCAWCYGAAIGPASAREYGDVRYTGKCRNPSCRRKDLMPFMRYCPWCQAKVARPWKAAGATDKCAGCRWGVFGEYWSHCPWCGRRMSTKS